MKRIVILLLVLCSHLTLCIKFYDHTLYRGIPINEQHLEFYKNLTDLYDVNFWTMPGRLNKPFEFTIGPEDNPDFLQDATRLGLYLTTVMTDVQSAFDKQTVKSYMRSQTNTFDWENYYRVDDVYNWMRDLAERNTDVMKLTNLGTTVEGRDILAVSINMEGQETGMKSSPRGTVILEGGVHAREWMTVAFVTYFLNEILHAPESNNEELKNIAYLYEWHFVPILNPDGYEYTHKINSKLSTRKMPYYYGFHHDVTIAASSSPSQDDNFLFTHGVSFSKSSITYCGKKAFSERESKAMSDFIRSKSSNLKYYLAFHSYGQYLIIPYGNHEKHLDNFDQVKSLATIAAKQVESKYGTNYTIGTAFDTVTYMTSGNSADWVKHNFKTFVAVTVELPDKGKYGFAMPTNLILPICRETSDLMIALLSPEEDQEKQHEFKENNSSQINKVLDLIVILSNVLLFIIVRLDYIEVLLIK